MFWMSRVVMPLRAQGQYLFVETFQPALVLADQPRLESAVAIAGSFKRNLVKIALNLTFLDDRPLPSPRPLITSFRILLDIIQVRGTRDRRTWNSESSLVRLLLQMGM